MKSHPDQELLQKLLIDDFEKRRTKNPSFSMRAYSRKLQINHSALSEILAGKRLVGRKLAERISESLALSPNIHDQLLTSAPHRTKDSKARQALRLKADQYKVISDWYYFAILSIAETDDFKSDPAWIAKRLGISKSTVQESLRRLERLKIIRIDSVGNVLLTGKSLDSPDGVASTAIRNTHHKYLELAHQSLDSIAVNKRYFNGMTMAIDSKKLPEAERRIREFRDEICQYLESGAKDEVYQLCLQLFPLSKEV